MEELISKIIMTSGLSTLLSIVSIGLSYEVDKQKGILDTKGELTKVEYFLVFSFLLSALVLIVSALINIWCF